MEKLINIIINLFVGLKATKFGRELLVLIVSAMPLLELRGGILAAALLDVNPLLAYVIAIIGNIIPIPFILFFVKGFIKWLSKSKLKLFNKMANILNDKVKKNKGKIEKYGYIGLILFVGIPLPGTGVWCGSLIAAVLDMDKKKSFACLATGMVIAGIIMMLISYGIIGQFI